MSDDFEWETTNQQTAKAKWSVPQEGIFKPGFKFPEPMTYKDMRDFVKLEHRKLGGDGLTVKARYKQGHEVPHHVVFKCSHGRKHADQAGKKKGSEGKRSDRSKENRRVLYSKCPFHFCVRLEPNCVLIKGTNTASNNEGGDADDEDEAPSKKII